MGLTRAEADEIVRACSPGFDDEPSPAQPITTVLGTSRISSALASLLSQWGAASTHLTSFPLPEDAGVVVLVGEFLADPSWNPHLTHTSTPHLPVLFSDLSITAGPLIVPGETPCLACMELWHRDDEPEWLSVGSQLWTTPAPTAHAQGAHHAAALCALLLGLMGSPGLLTHTPGLCLTTRFDTSDTTKHQVEFHPDCRCRAL